MSSSVRKLCETHLLVLLIMLLCAGGFIACSQNDNKAKVKTGEASSYSSKSVKEKDSNSLKPQTMCPVMDGEINKSLYADAKGYRIYVCCSGCISEIKKNPDKYIEKLRAMGVEIEKVPEKASTVK